jgi:opacity protein-like surface antigen
MRKILGLSAVLASTAVLSLDAHAEDPVSNHTYDWSGVYFGLNGGAGWAKDRSSSGCGMMTDIDDEEGDYYANLCNAISDGRVFQTDIGSGEGPNAGLENVDTLQLDWNNANYGSEFLAFISEQNDSDEMGWYGGLHIGLDHQFGRGVIGLELSGHIFSGIENQYSSSFDYFTDHDPDDTRDPPADGLDDYEASGVADFNSQLDWLTKATVRAGATFMANDRGMAYITGGGAVAHVSSSAEGSFDDDGCEPVCRAFNSGDDFYQFGLVAGAGLEFAVTQNVSVGAEYNYIHLYGQQDNTTTYTAEDGATWTYKYEAGFDSLHMASVKLSYRLD